MTLKDIEWSRDRSEWAMAPPSSPVKERLLTGLDPVVRHFTRAHNIREISFAIGAPLLNPLDSLQRSPCRRTARLGAFCGKWEWKWEDIGNKSKNRGEREGILVVMVPLDKILRHCLKITQEQSGPVNLTAGIYDFLLWCLYGYPLFKIIFVASLAYRDAVTFNSFFVSVSIVKMLAHV